MNLAKTISFVFMAMSIGLANANDFNEPKIKNALFEAGDSLKSKRVIPVNSLHVVESKKGELMMITNNGEYVIRGGTVYSVPYNMIINSIDDLDLSMRVNWRGLAIDPEKDLIGWVVNESAPEEGGVIFVAPKCSQCNELLAHLDQLDDYRFRIAVAPITGGEREYLDAIKAQCNGSPKALEALVEDTWSEFRFPIPNEGCEGARKSVHETVAAFTIIATGQPGFPLLVSESGRRMLGLPKTDEQLEAFINPAASTANNGDAQ
ncbi:hypothetical protein [Enterovibrio norvegicus]|uniref:hypothetical protein n=1 Tax=Enterovibrio norvegicus TaxID=188144 RepID=UPI00352F68B3